MRVLLIIFIVLAVIKGVPKTLRVDIRDIEIENHNRHMFQLIVAKVLTTSNDTVNIMIESNGGIYFYSTIYTDIIDSMSAKTVVHIDKYAASAGAIIALHADEIRVKPDARIMYHYVYRMVDGIKIIQTQNPEFRAWNKQYLDRALTEEEHEEYYRGEDIRWTGQEYANRYDKVKLK